MPKNIYPLEVFDFGVYRYSIMHIAFCAWLISSQTSPVLSMLRLEPFLEPLMYMTQICVDHTILQPHLCIQSKKICLLITYKQIV